MGLGRREVFDVVTGLAAIAAHVICDDVTGVVGDVIGAGVVGAWFNITAGSDIVKNSFGGGGLDVL